MPSNIPVAPKSQYEIERDERIKRNEAFMLSIGIDPHGGGYMKQNKKKAPPKPRAPKPYVPTSERRRSRRLQGGTAPDRDTVVRFVDQYVSLTLDPITGYVTKIEGDKFWVEFDGGGGDWFGEDELIVVAESLQGLAKMRAEF